MGWQTAKHPLQSVCVICGEVRSQRKEGLKMDERRERSKNNFIKSNRMKQGAGTGERRSRQVMLVVPVPGVSSAGQRTRWWRSGGSSPPPLSSSSCFWEELCPSPAEWVSCSAEFSSCRRSRGGADRGCSPAGGNDTSAGASQQNPAPVTPDTLGTITLEGNPKETSPLDIRGVF